MYGRPCDWQAPNKLFKARSGSAKSCKKSRRSSTRSARNAAASSISATMLSTVVAVTLVQIKPRVSLECGVERPAASMALGDSILLTATECTCGLCTRLACLPGPCLLLDLQVTQPQQSGTHSTSLVLQVRHPLEQCIIMPNKLHASHHVPLSMLQR